MKKFYDLYNDIEKDHIDISTVRYKIVKNMKLKDIEGTINQNVYSRVIEKKVPTREEDIELQKSMIRTICKTDDEEEFRNLLRRLVL